ncbi:MAG: YicC family protein [Clostridia bacterium]|nr:YicC family protein [Clostridia bacterium]
MVRSMTGFGSGQFSDGKRNITVEIRSVNHRYADISVKMPRRYAFAEEAIKKEIRKYVRRGKLDVSVSVENTTDEEVKISINTDLAKQYVESLTDLAEQLYIMDKPSLQYIASLPDVMKVTTAVEDEDEVRNSLCAAAGAAAEKLTGMRTVEGEKLADDIRRRADLIDKMAAEVEERSPETVKEYKERLDKRITELIGGALEGQEERIVLEAAVFADKVNVTEETVRLHSHVSQLKNLLSDDAECDGKKLDFIIQEMNREANTIGSKANDLTITNTVLELKSEIEKIREQVQNIE